MVDKCGNGLCLHGGFFGFYVWQLGKRFKPSQGLRQGDPLSLYLFLIVTDVLSRLIQGVVDGGFFEGISLNMHGPTLSHLLFVDDTLIFLRASLLNFHKIIQILNVYCTASGQEVSMQKSSIFFWANIPEGLWNELLSILGKPHVMDLGNYLGIPTTWGRLKRDALAFVKDRVMAKIQGWKQGFLS